MAALSPLITYKWAASGQFITTHGPRVEHALPDSVQAQRHVARAREASVIDWFCQNIDRSVPLWAKCIGEFQMSPRSGGRGASELPPLRCAAQPPSAR